MSELLKFSPGNSNAKLVNLAKHFGGKVYTFSLMSGYTCPFAKECLSKAVPDANGAFHIVDGPLTKWRCYSASQEVRLPGVRKQRQHNTDLLRAKADNWLGMTDLILDSLPKNAKIVRIHVGGDFFNRNYFNAWREVAHRKQDAIFYAYTKSLKFWVMERESMDDNDNFILTASYGGFADELIAKHNLRYVKVVESEADAEALGLEIDHDDSFAAKPEKRNTNFALLIHGPQPAGSQAGKAVRKLNGVGSYSKKRNKVKV